MIKVGLTGGIGSGKSSVSSMLKDMCIPIIDADIISKEVLNLYPEVLSEIRREFGEKYFNEEGKLKRRQLGNHIFSNDAERRKLEKIIIPFIKKEIFIKFEQYNSNGEKICVLDAPTLIEQDLHKSMDVVVLVWVDKETQVKRIKKRDNMNAEDINNRINAQMSLDEKKKKADFIINNSGSIEDTKAQVEAVFIAIKESEGEK